MSDTALRAGLIRLAHARPDLRPVLLPVIHTAASKRGPGSVWKTQGGNWRAINEKGEAKSFGDDQSAANAHAGKAESDAPAGGGAAAEVDNKKKTPKKPKGIKVNVTDDLIEARRPSVSDDLKGYGSDATEADLKPEHREELKGYDLTIVGSDAAQAVEIARKLKEGIEKGADICKMNPPVCAGNKGLTRAQMPQIEGERTVKQMLEATKKDGSPDEESRAKGRAMVQAGADPDSDKTIMQTMIDHYLTNGVKTKRTKAPVGMLKATQAEIQAAKTYSFASNFLKGQFENIGNSVVVSRDGHILDGHHRWAALLTVDPSREMDVQVIDMDMDDLLREAQAVPGVYKANIDGNPLPEDEQKAYKAEAKSKFKAKGKGKKPKGKRAFDLTASFDVQASYNRAADADRARIEGAVIRLAHAHPEFRPTLRAVLAHIKTDRAVRAAFGN